MSVYTEAFGSELLTREGAVATDKFLEGKKIIGVYFSAHWGPPCQQFTPILNEFHAVVCESGFEIVFVSSDKSHENCMNFYNESHGPWGVVPYGSAEVTKLKEKFNITGIPSLVILRASDLHLITTAGRDHVSGKEPTAAMRDWCR